MVKGECLPLGGYRLGFKLAFDRTCVPRLVQMQVKGCLPENLKNTNKKPQTSIPCPFSLRILVGFVYFFPVPEGSNFNVFHRCLVWHCNLPAKFMSKSIVTILVTKFTWRWWFGVFFVTIIFNQPVTFSR